MQQVERELMEANRSATFWRSQIPFFEDEPLKSTVERSLQNALVEIAQLHHARYTIRNA